MSVTKSTEPSQHEANKMIRVLTGRTLKFTCRMFYPSGACIEFQTDDQPKLDWNAEARALWYTQGGYGGAPICPVEPGMVVLCEPNPKSSE